MPPAPPPGSPPAGAPSAGAPPALPPQLAKLLYDGYQLQLRADYEGAARLYRKLLKSAPDHVDVIHLLGIVRARQSREKEAIELYRKVLARRPQDAKAWYNLALALGAIKDEPASIEAMEHAFALDKSLPLAPHILFPARRAAADWRDHDHLVQGLRAGVALSEAPPQPFLFLYLDDPALQLAAARRKVAQELTPKRLLSFDHAARRQAEGPIRVAYLSADFRNHPTTHLVKRLFARHDRSRFEVTAISIGPDDGSTHRRAVKAAVDRFVDLEGAKPEDIARHVAGLGVDILVDLMGHTKGEQMGTFAHRPAPVQVAFLGYGATTGAPWLDYMIGDPVVLPFSDAAFFSEKLVQLPEVYQPNDPELAVAPQPTRAECGLPQDAFVFVCFNGHAKIDPETFSSFMRVLGAVPGSVLWLLEGQAGAADKLRREAAARGVDPARLVFAPAAPLEEHLARIGLADLFLDTFPYTAHTTASDALRRGVPIVTRTGRTFASRVAASLLRQVDLADLVTTAPAALEAKAIALARDPAAMAAARARLAAALPGSPVLDIDRFTRHLETAFETMMARWRAGTPPQAFAVEPLPRA